jgi:alkanesulfonate monooxygenase SsuD/methylene tetrahydromethanopterin reductase-like flavin-dependent oxidoreductase (luciferase family)
MPTGRLDLMEFGYSPPPGDREMGAIDPATFVADLDRVVEAVAPWASSIWISDHFMEHAGYRAEPWTQLTWIAARHPGPLLGHCVLGNSYRHPPLLAKMAASLQALSGGRFILGIGSGWLEPEYRGYGYAFPPTPVRIAQLDEALRLMKTLWYDQPATFTGQWFRLEEAWCVPAPNPPIPILVAGGGEKYLLRVVAEHADWWLSYADRPEVLRRKLDVLADHCAAVGRDPATIRKATPMTVYLARSAIRAREWAGAATEGERPAFAGDPAALVDRIRELEGLGFELVQLRFAGLFDTTDLDLFRDEVLPAFR